MAYDTAFYIFGGALAAIAVLTSFAGLRSEKFPGRAAPLVILAFTALIGVTVTYAVLNGQEEAEHRAHELEQAGAEVEHGEEEPVAESGEVALRSRPGAAPAARCSWPPPRPKSPTTRPS